MSKSNAMFMDWLESLTPEQQEEYDNRQTEPVGGIPDDTRATSNTENTNIGE